MWEGSAHGGRDRCLYHQHTAVSINQALLRPLATTSEVEGLFLEQHQRVNVSRGLSVWIAAHDTCHAKPQYRHFITALERGEHDQAEDRGLRLNQAEAHFMSALFLFQYVLTPSILLISWIVRVLCCG